MGLSTLIRPLVIAAAVLLAQSASAQLLNGVTRWRPGLGAVVPSYQGPGDIAPGAIAWYGLRAFSHTYVGSLIRVQRLNDDKQCDIAPSSTGGLGQTVNCFDSTLNNIDVATFCSGTQCPVLALYDQTVSNVCTAASCDIVQSISSSQPNLTLNCLGTLPCITFVGVQQFKTAGALIQAQPLSVVAVAEYTGSGSTTSMTLAGDSDEVQLGFAAFGTTDIYAYAGALADISGQPANTFRTMQFIASDPTSKLTINGNPNSISAGTSGFTSKVTLGAMVGQFTEGGIWPTALTTTQQTNLNTNMRSYWGF
jgi:hypothetical protein